MIQEKVIYIFFLSENKNGLTEAYIEMFPQFLAVQKHSNGFLENKFLENKFSLICRMNVAWSTRFAFPGSVLKLINFNSLLLYCTK